MDERGNGSPPGARSGKRPPAASSASPLKISEAAEPAAGSATEQNTRISTSRGLAEWLAMRRLSFAFSSYQTGQLLLVGRTPRGRVSIQQRHFQRAMGLWGQSDRLYIAAISEVWRLENCLKRTQRVNDQFDRLYIPRNAQVTGDLDIHELGVDKTGRVVFVNTKYSCLATFSMTHSFKLLWKPKFITKLAPEDRCHLNGLAIVDGAPKYVTAVSSSDVLNGWRERRHEGGVIIDIDTNRVITDELSMPHSPRLANGTLYVLDSGRGFLVRVDTQTGSREDLAFCPGFLRGLAIVPGFALVTSSLPRDGTFKGLELEENLARRDGEARCGVFIIDLKNGDIVHWLRLDGYIKELFSVVALPRVNCPMALGSQSPEVAQTITIEE